MYQLIMYIPQFSIFPYSAVIAQIGRNWKDGIEDKFEGTEQSTGPCIDKTKRIVEPAIPLFGSKVGKSEKSTGCESLVFQTPRGSKK